MRLAKRGQSVQVIPTRSPGDSSFEVADGPPALDQCALSVAAKLMRFCGCARMMPLRGLSMSAMTCPLALFAP
jgi:hypothetical protein